MFHPIVKGTYYDMGYRYGTIIHKHGFRVEEQPNEKLGFGRKSEGEVKRVFPEILEEIKGFADACHASYENVSAFMHSIGAFKVQPMCSAFAAFNGDDVVFGRNYDFFYSFKKFTESYLTCPNDGYWSLGHTDVFIGREDGINEKGLAVAMTGIAEKAIKPGISFCLALRCVLDKCATVEEGIRLISNAHISATDSYLLADKEGNMAVVEYSPDKTRVRHPEEGNDFIVCTNHFVHPEMQEMEDLKERSRCNWDSLARYSTISAMLKERSREVDAKHAQKILANHSGYVCSHQNKIMLGTIWSVTASLGQLQIFRAERHPCKTKYKQDLRLNKALQRRA